MNIETLHRMLAWSLLINYAILIIWFVAFIAFHQLIYDLHTVWFRLSPERFDAIHYLGMAIYKVIVMIFILSPYLALHIIRPRKEN